MPFGLVGGRLYHVITDWQLYFGPDAPNEPIEALFIWNGGLGIWGAVALGGVGVWLGCRSRGLSLGAVADTVAPGIVIAQAIGRWGNYFNQELFGSPTDLPWGLEIDPDRPGTVPGVATYHPTFLYESIWDLALGLALIWVGQPVRAAPRPAVRALRRRLHRGPVLDRGPAGRHRPPTSSACGSTSGPRSCCSSAR